MANLRRQSDGFYPVTIQEFKESFPNLSFGEQIDFVPYGYDVVFDSPLPTLLPLQRAIESTPIFDSGIWMQTWTVQDDLLSITDDQKSALTISYKQQRCKELSTHRYNIEIGGIVRNGLAIPTDRNSQFCINAALNGLNLNPGTTIQWGTPDGIFVTLDQAGLQGLFNQIFTFVQSCRAYEKVMFDEINVLTDPRAVLSFDFTQGWPA